LKIFDSLNMKCAVAAPTGRAAKRISQTSNKEAQTIHRLLEVGFSKEEYGEFARNEENPLNHDVVIIDEFSMVDVILFFSILKAIKPETRLILIGDKDQLESVGPGNLLADIIKSGEFKVCTLNEIFRQSENSFIITNAHKINNGENPQFSNKNGDFFFMPRKSPKESAECVLELCSSRLPNTYGKDILQHTQVICCTKKGDLGTHNLNLILQNALNPPSKNKAEKPFKSVIFRENDKVMQIKNNYDLEWNSENGHGCGVFNGDIGVISEIDFQNECLYVNYDGKVAAYDFCLLDELEHAYAITVHKSQGSEYPILIFPIFDAPYMLSTRNLLYTAITRAKKMVIIVGNREKLFSMVKNSRSVTRHTALCHMLKKYT